ncbi:PhzF family phenazine biosynthesis isomerase [Dactylosporangium aurantiacum]|uniref:PhzF family phenazine biosynthesis isomerase n=1 Tax=Dactylosporangium aurantiacum TaxID=35754 RepID=A0A9Q9I9P8_9ACTN|nr:PhzF family phenazine biosynthesis isomerase [Dactylosporangium aurantiacum]MDG6106520.1 PhzF family phenazine biosynthesis isomerase [Dactylosporangium aurantiacum]UWZ50450.1 PhzF family phenazine biosynthesis isomerase [Dactylosporangium aurantiacum]
MEILRYSAFTTDPKGGNPAGVVLDATGLDDAAMQAIAADVGYSETAFLSGDRSGERIGVRYFSPLAEVPFCGHATIATAAAYAERFGLGPLRLQSRVGPIDVETRVGVDGLTATLRSVPPHTEPVDAAVLKALLRALRWDAADLDPALPVRVAYAGARHPVVAAATRARLADLDYDVPALTELMRRHDWTTVDLVWRESAAVFHARNPFPPGGVYDDPATGAAAAAFGGYLRELALVDVPATLRIHQGHDLGRPSLVTVELDARPGSGVAVTGTAVPIP